jgi:membrane fusion protein, heavy metal efflux system
MTRAALTLFSVLLLATASPSLAGDDHDHGPEITVAGGPQRLPDGSVFLPKPAQRQIAVRTVEVTQQQLPRAIELNGRIVMDPNAGGRVQAMVAGRLEAGPRGFPALGQAVRKGEVLAYVVPASDTLERASQAAQLAELRAARDLAQKRVARLRELSDTVPRKDIEAAESELASLGARAAAIGTGLNSREALLAPASGVIASAQAVAGQVIDARELVFEIVDPARLRVEAVAFDAAVAQDIAGGFIASGADKVALKFVGAARALREQALPIAFTASVGSLGAFAVGQPVKVIVQTRSQRAGVPVPAAALMKNPANQTIVWVKLAPERFSPRVVQTEPLDGANVIVTSGLQAGERVAVQGAGLVNQVR